MVKLTTKGLLATAVLGISALIAAACTGGSSDKPSQDDLVASGEIIEGGEVEDIPQVVGWNTNWSKRTIDLSELIAGRPESDPRDVIRPLDSPKFEGVTAADEWLEDREPGILLQLENEARYYPLRILTVHEIVNDEVAGRPAVITFCPLCNSAVAFDPTVDGKVLRFGTSGLLRFSDLVMWDSTTESFWQQITGEAIVGDLAGTTLEFLPTSIIPWSEFQDGFPNGQVLSLDTGFPFLYGLNSYVGYSSNPVPFAFKGEIDDRFFPLERVVGAIVDSQDKAYPFSVISKERAVNDEVAGVPIAVLWGAPDTADALDNQVIPEGQAIGAGVAYERTVDGQVLTFTPLDDNTYKDNETGTVWSILGVATEGPLAGQELTPVVHANHFWFAWAVFNPDDPVYAGSDS